MQKEAAVLRPEIKIQNTVSTAELDQKIDIALFNRHEHLSSNLDLYRCGYVKDDKMTGRVTVFGNGKMIPVGTKSPEQSRAELRKAVKILQEHGLARHVKITPNIRNIVAGIDLGQVLPIERLARTIPRSMYEPEQFPGLICRMQGSCVVLLFASGKGIIVGARTVEEVNSTFFDIKSQI